MAQPENTDEQVEDIMKNFKIRTVCAALILTVGLTGLTGCGAAKLDGSQTVAVIGEEKVTLGVANFALRYSQAQSNYYFQQLSAIYEGGIMAPKWDEVREGETKTTGELTKQEIIDRLEQMSVVRAHAKDYGVELTQEDKDKITAAAQEFITNNDESVLARMGVTQADVEEFLELETYYEKCYEPMVAEKNISVTDEEAKQSTVTYSFVSNNNLETDEAKEKLEELLDQYKAEDDIATFDMVGFTEEMEGIMTSTASFGEDEEAGTGLDDAVKEAARTLKDGELYQEVIEGAAGGGFFVVRLDKESDPEATERKKESLVKEREQVAFDEMVENWADEVETTVYEDVWKKANLSDKESYVLKISKPDTTTDVNEETPSETTESELETEEEAGE